MATVKNLLAVLRRSRPTSRYHPSVQQALFRQQPHHSGAFRVALLPRSTRSFYTSQVRQQQQTSVQTHAHERPLSIPGGSPSVTPPQDQTHPPEEEPAYQLTFTCKPCGQRSTHRISKRGYHRGAVLISCPGCPNRHVISDHLGIFADRAFTLEDILKKRGDLVRRGTVSADGDVEFWAEEHGSENTHEHKQ